MTTFKSFLDAHVAYNTWANKRISQWLKDGDLANHQTIIETLQHLSIAQEFWASFVNKKKDGQFTWQRPLKQVEEEIKFFESTTLLFETSCLSFSEEALLEVLHFTSDWAENRLSRFYYVVHCINHNTHHRGQIIKLARLLDYKGEIPHTEYSIFVGNYSQPL